MEDVKRDWASIKSDEVGAIVKMTGEWRRSKGFETGWHNFSEKLMLVITEGDEAMEALDGIGAAKSVLAAPGFYRIGDACQKLMHYVENYAEEWADVMVRIFDVADACGLEIDVIESYGDGPTASAIPYAELVSSRGLIRFSMLCRALSQAMECFRDVKLVECGNGELAPEETSQNREAMAKIGGWLTNAALVAAHAIEDVGVFWEKVYALKMEVNEGRPPKHGRER